MDDDQTRREDRRIRRLMRWMQVILSVGIITGNVITGILPPRRTTRRSFPLFDAIEAGDAAKVRTLLDAGSDPDGRLTQADWHYGLWPRLTEVPEMAAKTPLMAAADSGSIEIVRLLLDSGADVLATRSFGDTALYWALSAECKEEMINLLLDRASDVNPPVQFGGPLSVAASEAGPEVVRLLLDRGADVNPPAGEPPLASAAAACRPDIVRMLIEAGAKVKAVDEQGFTALMEPAGAGHTAVVELLIAAGIDVNARNKEGLTALTYAKNDRRTNIVDILLRAGAAE